MFFGGKAPWEEGSAASKIPWAPASTALKNIGSKAADAAGYSTPELDGGYQAAEIIGSVVGGGGVARGAAALPKVAKGIESGIELASKAPIVGKAIGKAANWMNPVPAYSLAAERAAQSTSKLGAAAENIAPHVRDLGIGAGIVGGQQIGEATDSPEVGLISSLILGAAGGAGGGVAANKIAREVPGSLSALAKGDIPSVLSRYRPEDVNQAAVDMRAASRINENLGPEAAAEMIADATKRQRDAGLPVLSNALEMPMDSGLAALSKRNRADPEIGARYITTNRQINDQIVKGTAKAFGPDVPTAPERATDFVQTQAQTRLAQADAGVADAERGFGAAKKDLEDFNTQQFNQAFDDKGLRATTLKQEAATGIEAQMDAFNKSNRANYAAAGEVGGPEAKALIDQRSEISKAVGAARANGDIPTIRSLLSEAENVDAQINAIKEANPDFAKAMDDAESSFKAGAPTFRSADGRTTPAGALNEQKLANVAPPKSQVLDTFTSSREGVDNLRAVLSTDAGALNKAGEAVVADLIPAAGASGELTPAAVRSYLTKNADVLAQFPEQKTRLETTLSNLVNKTNKVDELQTKVKEATANKARTVEDLNTSAARFFIGKDPKNAAKSVLESKNITKDMKDVVATLRQDPTGAAEQGFKQALMEEVVPRTTSNKTPTVTKMSRLDARVRNAMIDSGLYTKEQMESLDVFTDQLEMIQKATGQALPGSSTTDNLGVREFLNDPATALGTRLIPGGNPLANIGLLNNLKLAWDTMTDRSTTARSKAIKEIIYKAERDPELAQLLLRKPVDTQQQAAFNRELNRLVNLSAYTQDKADDSRENNKPAKAP